MSSSRTYAPRRADFVTDVDYCAAVETYETAFMQRLALVPPRDFSDGSHADEEYEIDWGVGVPPRQRVERNYALRYQALAREALDAVLDDCCVCYGELTRAKSVTTNCGHTFCASCMTSCLARTSSCPCCRTVVSSLTRYRARRGSRK